MPKPVTIVVAPSVSDEFSPARTYLHAAKMSMAQSAAFMILAGGELERLHKLHGTHAGRRVANSFNTERINWEDLIQRELGISGPTAWRYREMFKAAKKRVPQLNAAELLETPMGQLPEIKQKQLLAAVQKCTDGATAQQLMWDWGLAKLPQGSGAKGGNTRGKGGDEPEPDADGNLPPHPDTPEARGWHAITDHLNNLLVEHLDPRNNYWYQCDEAARRELHGNLIDAARRVAESLDPAKTKGPRA